MNRRTLALASCSGLLLVASFPVIGINLLAWISLIPLLLALKGQTVRNAMLLGGICGLVFFSGTVYWLAESIHVYGGLPLFPAALLTLLLCTYLALYPALFAAVLAYLAAQKAPARYLAAPAVWTSLELARTHLFTGFPWALLGYSQYTALPVIQVADISGVYGVSFLIVFVNAALAAFLEDPRNSLPILSAAVVVSLVLGYGWLRLRPGNPGIGFRISVIQGNIEQDRKWDPAYRRATFSTYQRLTQAALRNRPDLVIWPETSTPFYFRGDDPDDRTMSSELAAFVKASRAPLLFGSPTCDSARPGGWVLHNSAFLMGADGKVSAVYRKLHLVPFGEYVPIESILFFVRKMVQSDGEFEPGRDYTLMSVSGSTGSKTAVGTVICYEAIFPDLVRTFVNRGARIVTIITNDAWFGNSAAPYQHFAMVVFRAVENRVPVARAANTGISGFIDSTGHILASTSIFTEGHLTRTLFPGRTTTLYTAWGDLFSYLCILASFAFLINASKKN